jgi:hypothetical protein
LRTRLFRKFPLTGKNTGKFPNFCFGISCTPRPSITFPAAHADTREVQVCNRTGNLMRASGKLVQLTGKCCSPAWGWYQKLKRPSTSFAGPRVLHHAYIGRAFMLTGKDSIPSLFTVGLDRAICQSSTSQTQLEEVCQRSVKVQQQSIPFVQLHIQTARITMQTGPRCVERLVVPTIWSDAITQTAKGHHVSCVCLQNPGKRLRSPSSRDATTIEAVARQVYSECFSNAAST